MIFCYMYIIMNMNVFRARVQVLILFVACPVLGRFVGISAISEI